jgi:hypothetical protein
VRGGLLITAYCDAPSRRGHRARMYRRSGGLLLNLGDQGEVKPAL